MLRLPIFHLARTTGTLTRKQYQWPKGRQNLYNRIGKGHRHPPVQDSAFVGFYLTSRGFLVSFFSHKCTKSR